MRKRKPAHEIIPPGESQNLLGWDRGRPSQQMLHHRPPCAEPPPLPSAILLQLQRTLEDALRLCTAGDLTRPVAARMLECLAPVVRREEDYRRRKASELRFSESDHQLADNIENLLLFGGEAEYSRKEISVYLHRNKSSEQITVALSLLRVSGRAVTRRAVRFRHHKAAELWRLTRPSDDICGYPLPPIDARLPRQPKPIDRELDHRQLPGATIAVPRRPPIWGLDDCPDDPRVVKAVARWEARQRGKKVLGQVDRRVDRRS